ncbi:MAG: four helix bundle protein [Chloroflexi bacterium]|nr:four helix bundle protein [Chloroflexota bacterium]
MTKIRRFEDLICWQKARVLVNTIHRLTHRDEFSRDFRLRNQILDAAGSVMHNIAEGGDAGTDPEFIRFLKMARRSASEVQSEVYLALDRKYITDTELKQAYDQADEAKRLINGLIAYLRQGGRNNEKRISKEQGDDAPKMKKAPTVSPTTIGL